MGQVGSEGQASFFCRRQRWIMPAESPDSMPLRHAAGDEPRRCRASHWYRCPLWQEGLYTAPGTLVASKGSGQSLELAADALSVGAGDTRRLTLLSSWGTVTISSTLFKRKR